MSADYTLYLESARAAAGSQSHPAPALYMVATPIGNLADMGLRAVHVLQLADVVFCEDTRHSRTLLRQYGLHKELRALHQHNEQQASQTVLHHLEQGHRVAYISDAGTPGISDPGSVLCRNIRTAGHRVVPIPGANSVGALLSVAGCDARQGYVFSGFLPSKNKARNSVLQAFLGQPLPVVFFESPHRLRPLAESLHGLCAADMGHAIWMLLVGRELTKQFEQTACMPAHALGQWLDESSHHLRGEFVFLLYRAADLGTVAQQEKHQVDVAAESLLRDLLAYVPTKVAASIASRHTGESKKALYERAVQLKKAQ